MSRLLQLFDVMLPVAAANMAAPFARVFGRRWPTAVTPVSERWLGRHKTWLGYALALSAATAVAGLQAWVAWPGALPRAAPWWWVGPTCGVGAMAGDTLKSFVKRRLGIAPGHRWVPADQIDFLLGGLASLACFVDLDGTDVALVLAAGFAATLAVDRLAFRLHVKDTPW